MSLYNAKSKKIVTFLKKLLGIKSLYEKLNSTETRLADLAKSDPTGVEAKNLKRYRKVLRDAIQTLEDRERAEHAYNDLADGDNVASDDGDETAPGHVLLKKLNEAKQNEKDALKEVAKVEKEM